MDDTSVESPRSRLEKFVLGAIIWGHHSEIINAVLVDDFISSVGKKIIALLKKRSDAGEPTDESIMSSSEVGTESIYISDCSDVYYKKYDDAFIKTEVDRLISASDLQFIADGFTAIRASMSSRDIYEVSQAINEMQYLQDKVASRHNIKKDKLVGESVMDGFRQVEKNLMAGRLKMGFPSLDRWMGGGFKQGEFIVIGARTSIGKSIVSLYPIIEAARSGKWAMLCSNEMTDAQMSLRMVANMSGVEMGVIEKIYAGTSVQNQLMATASVELRKLPIIMKPDCFHVSEIVETLQDRKQRGIPVSLIVVDYLQNMLSDNPRVNQQYDKMAEVCRNLLGVAKRYNCVIIGMSQVNREGEFSDKIKKEHLEGAGVIEQTADKIFLMYADKTDKEVRNIELAKDRNGRTRDYPFKMKLDGARMNFTEIPQ